MLKIGDVNLNSRVALAPMAGVTDLPYRKICVAMGAGLVVSEMVSAKAITYNNSKTYELLKIDEGEHPIAVQLFGSEHEIMADAAGKISDAGMDIIDINMGCPMPKIVNNGDGSALMKNPELAGRIVESICKCTDKPVTVKIRSGFDKTSVNAAKMAKVLEQAGAAAITVHGRTREEYYSGLSDWDVIRDVKENVKIPVFGNGDVVDEQSAIAMLEYTGCDGVMIGRAGRGNPWIFRTVGAAVDEYFKYKEGHGYSAASVKDAKSSGTAYIEAEEDYGRIKDLLAQVPYYVEHRVSAEDCSGVKISGKNGNIISDVTLDEMKRVMLKHFNSLIEVKGEYIAVREMRKHFAWYTAGIGHACEYRNAVNKAKTAAEVLELINKLGR